MKKARAVAFAAAGALAISFVGARADAYCRTKACDTDPSYGDVWDEQPQPTRCERNAQGCYLEGTPLYWPSTCVSFGVQRSGSKTSGIDFETASAVVEGSFLKWNVVDCGDGKQPSFRFVNKGAVDCHEAEYNQESGNANNFLFRDDAWPYMNQIDTLALTTVTYNIETAAIYDADVEINTAQATFSTVDDPDEHEADLDSVVTHEVGHFLGLAHSEVNAATMRSIGYQLGTIGLRTLADDDIRGICEIYPPGQAIGDACEPRHGFSRECGPKDDGCALGHGTHGRARGTAVAAMVGLAYVARRKRRARVLR